MVKDLNDAVDVIESVPMLIESDAPRRHNSSIKGQNDLIGEPALADSVNVDTLGIIR